jgi:hypothetical protein
MNAPNCLNMIAKKCSKRKASNNVGSGATVGARS